LKCPSSFLNCSFFKNCNFSFYFELMWWSCFLFWQMELQDAPYWRQYHGRRIEMHRRNH
jgi:hypothetical protein